MLSDPILIFTLFTLIILVAPLLAERIKIPDIVLLMFAGVIIGPKWLGIIDSDSKIKLFASVGLLYIMFLAGIEIDLHRFVQTIKKSSIFGILTFIIPQTIGTLVGKYLLGFDWLCSILLASMFASHTLLSYPIASRLGISRSEPVTVTVGATIVTDTLALLVLAVIADSKRGVNIGPLFWLGLALGMCILILLIWYGIPRLSKWFFGNVTEEGGAQFLFVIAILCGCAYISHFAKLEPIIGAFLAGAAFNRLIPQNSVLMNRVVFAGKTIFIPFFLISVGMLVDPLAILTTPSTWIVSAAMVITVITTKYAAALVAGSLFRYNNDTINVMFGLSVVQAAATLAAVIVGYNLEIFDISVLNGAIAMIAVTCPLGAWMVDRFGRKVATQQASNRKEVTLNEQKILVPVANPASAFNLLDFAFCIRNPSIPGEIAAISIVNSDDDDDTSVLNAEKLLADCLAHANSAEMTLIPSVRIASNLSDGLVRSAKELRSTLVMAGWPAISSTQTRIFASFAENLIADCPKSLLFSRLVKSVNSTQRLLILSPPMASARLGLKTLMSDLKYLSTQIACEIKIFLSSDDSNRFREIADSAKPQRAISYEYSDSISEARTKIMSQIKEDDMILILAERRDSAIWSPTLDRLSEILIENFPNNNILLHYPQKPQQDDFSNLIFEEDLSTEVKISSCELNNVNNLDELIEQIIKSYAEPTPTNSLTQELSKLLSECGKNYPLKLSEDIVLLHAHSEKITEPILIVARSEKKFSLLESKIQAKLVLTLFNPKIASPSSHLRTLSKIGKIFHDKDSFAKIAKSHSAAEIAKILKEKMASI